MILSALPRGPSPRSTDSPTTSYFDRSGATGFLNGNLPHWRQEVATYYVTFRLADSLPRVVIDRVEEDRNRWLRANPEPHSLTQRKEYRRFFMAMERHLDAGYGACLLRNQRAQTIVRDTLLFFDGERYLLHDWVLMPNHVHLQMTTMPSRDLTGILHSIKSFSAKEINRALGRRGKVWQKESFDHIVRNAESFERFRTYIKRNPMGLESGEFLLGIERHSWTETELTRRDATPTSPRRSRTTRLS